jgi:predicted RNA-binding Zn ribbon-like protein
MTHAENTFTTHGFGKVAPWVDLVNSEEWDGFGNYADRLNDPAWLAAFLHHWRLRPLVAGKVPHRKFRLLRDLLRRTAGQLARGRLPNARDFAQLNAILSAPVRRRLVRVQGSLRIEILPVRSDWSWVRSRIAASAAEALAGADARRLKFCANPDCRWLFHDPTKARTKLWCNDRTCGNRARVRRARAAQRD